MKFSSVISKMMKKIDPPNYEVGRPLPGKKTKKSII